MPEQIIIFRIGTELCGVGLDSVCEVIQASGVRAVSDSPGLVDGVIDLRGVSVPVIDFRKKLGIYCRDNRVDEWVVIFSVNDNQVGIIVDDVLDVAQLGSDSVEPLRSLLHTCHTRFLRGFGQLGERKILLVSPDKIIDKVRSYNCTALNVV